MTVSSARETLARIADELHVRVMEAAVRAVAFAATKPPEPLPEPAAKSVTRQPEPPAEAITPAVTASQPAPESKAEPFDFVPLLQLQARPESEPAAPVLPPAVETTDPPSEPVSPITVAEPVDAIPEPPPALPTTVVDESVQQPAPADEQAVATRPIALQSDRPSLLAVARAAIPAIPLSAVLTLLPLTLALVALVLAIVQGYQFQASIEAIERAAVRAEYARTCRDLGQAYYEVKQKVSVLMPAADRGNIAGASRVTEGNRLDAQGAVGRIASYFTGFQDDAARTRVANLTRALGGVLERARATQLTDIDKLFEPADRLFAQLNDDCARLTRAARS